MTAGLPRLKTVLVLALIVLSVMLIGVADTFEQKREPIHSQAQSQARTRSAYQKMTQSQTRQQQHTHSHARVEAKAAQGQAQGNGNHGQEKGQQSSGRRNGS